MNYILTSMNLFSAVMCGVAFLTTHGGYSLTLLCAVVSIASTSLFLRGLYTIFKAEGGQR